MTILNEIQNMFTRTNILARRFAKCYVAMTVKLSMIFAYMSLVYGLDTRWDLLTNRCRAIINVLIGTVLLKFYWTWICQVLVLLCFTLLSFLTITGV